jgi:hypothetical protein
MYSFLKIYVDEKEEILIRQSGFIFFKVQSKFDPFIAP